MKSAETLYSVHPAVAMTQKWVASLKEKTGRTLEEWIEFIQKKGPSDEKQRRDWLKKDFQLGTNTAWWLAERASQPGELGIADDDPQEYLRAAVKYVEDMYAGAKAGLRPIHDELIRLGRALGKDVKICPCKTIVPFYRQHVFAEIKPSTRTRLDFGLALTKYGKKIPQRLIDTGGAAKKDRITHRIPLASAAEVDAEVQKWFGIAYELDGPA
jgi:hypothetical protein